MEVFPFSTDDWSRVNGMAREIVNASLMDDDALSASKKEHLRELLAELRDRYGEHPILLETEADFEDDPQLQAKRYFTAIALAESNFLPTYTKRISLAELLIDELQDPAGAAQQLAACEQEVLEQGDEYERQQWRELLCRSRGD